MCWNSLHRSVYFNSLQIFVHLKYVHGTFSSVVVHLKCVHKTQLPKIQCVRFFFSHSISFRCYVERLYQCVFLRNTIRICIKYFIFMPMTATMHSFSRDFTNLVCAYFARIKINSIHVKSLRKTILNT